MLLALRPWRGIKMLTDNTRILNSRNPMKLFHTTVAVLVRRGRVTPAS
jgi:hypothetical protein